jgi:nitrate/TMAO reductase-like tetraheme cytochrome c subunit
MLYPRKLIIFFDWEGLAFFSANILPPLTHIATILTAIGVAVLLSTIHRFHQLLNILEKYEQCILINFLSEFLCHSCHPATIASEYDLA